MKKQYTFLLVALLSMLGFSANAGVALHVKPEGAVVQIKDASNQTVATLQPGDNNVDLANWTPYYIVPGDGQTLTEVTNKDGIAQELAVDAAWSETNYCVISPSMYYNDYTITTDGGKSEPVAEGVSFTLENGTAKIYIDSYSDPTFVTDLTAGQTTTLDLISGKNYAIVAGDGLTLTAIDSEGNSAWVNEPEWGSYGAYYVTVPAYQTNTYTISTKTAPVKKDNYDVTFELPNGGSFMVFYYDMNNGWARVDLATDVTNGTVLTLPANNSYTCQPNDGYEFVGVTDADGATVTLESWNTPATFTVNTSTVPSEKFIVDMKSNAPVQTGVNFYVEEGCQAILWNYRKWSKVQDLATGDNFVTLEDAPANSYVVIGVGIQNVDEFSVVAEDGTALGINPFDSALGGVSTKTITKASASTKYTIKKVEAPVVVEGYKTVINVAAGTSVEGRYQDATLTWQTISLNEGANNVEIPKDAMPEFRIVLKNNDDAANTTCVTNTGAQLAQTYQSFQGYYYYSLTPAEFAESYTVTTTAPAPAGYKVKFTAVGGDVDLRGYVPDQGTVTLKTVNPGTPLDYDLEADDCIYIYAAEGYELVSVTDADGNVMTLDQTNGVYCYELDCEAAAPSSAYTVTVKAPKADGTVFNVAQGSKAELKILNWTTYGYDLVETLNEGENIVKLNNDEMYAVFAAAGNALVSVTDAEGNALKLTASGEDQIAQISTMDATPSASYTIVTEATAAPADVFTVIVDDASKVYMSSNWKKIELTDGVNELDPATLTAGLSISGIQCTLYTVTLDGVALVPEWGVFNVATPEAGQVLDIKANYPDEDWTVNFVFTDAATSGMITRAAIEKLEGGESIYTDVPIVNNSITVKAGSNIALWATDPDNYIVSSVTAPDGSALTWANFATEPGKEPWPNINFTVNKTGDLKIDAKVKQESINVTFNITGDPADVSITYGDPASQDAFTNVPNLKTGVNTVTMTGGWGVRLSGDAVKSVSFKKDAAAALENVIQSIYDMTWYAGPFSEGGEINIEIDSEETPTPAETFDITVTVNNPDEVKLYTYYSYYTPERNVELECNLVAGVNTVKVPVEQGSDMVQLTVAGATHESVINSVKSRNDATSEWTNVSEAYPNAYDVFVKAGTELDIDAEGVSYDSSCTVYTDLGGNYQFTLTSANGRKITLVGGDNTVYFNADENPFTLECGNRELAIYVDGELQTGNTITLTEGALVKAFAGTSTPVKVDFVINALTVESNDFKVVNVKLDGRTDVTDLSNPVEMLPGTTVTFEIEAPEDVTYTVTYGDETLTPNAEGVYTIWPREDSNVKIDYTVAVELALFLEVTNGENVENVEMTEAEGLWTVKLESLSGSFRITSNDNSVDLGSNGKEVELGVPYTARSKAEQGMTLACGAATDVTVTVDPATRKVTVEGTTGIESISVDQLDMDALYFDLAGRRIAARNVVNGFYIQVANGVARKIAVK